MTTAGPLSGPPGQTGRPDPPRLTAAMPISRRRLFHPGSTREPPEAATAPPSRAGNPVPWRAESQAAPLAEISVDADRCSACGCCALACPTGALVTAYTGEPVLTLWFATAGCSACGACISACPEGAVSLGRVADRASLPAGRRPVARIAVGNRCRSCGRPLAGGLVGDVVGQRLATSHPEIAARLQHQGRCTDCLLTGRPPAIAGPADPRQ